ncbi:hypothetical protein EGI05_10945 [Chryseobacterium daecheongense]|uniref:Uncharacterized protein n=2 Tax=Chryseobacterium daecheongense TaxID=192389 RepID=A0A3N0VYG9_9FLAO|nr:hypothetical protein EGI05_10945 [Chryseobacterium daecheongense]
MLGYKDNTGLFVEVVPKGNGGQDEHISYAAYIVGMLLGILTVSQLIKPQKDILQYNNQILQILVLISNYTKSGQY